MSMRGTVLIYNGVQVDNVSTDSIEQEAFLDKTNADQIGIKVTISVTGLLHAFPVSLAAFSLGSYVGNPAGGNGGVNINWITEKLQFLNTPMRRLQYWVGSELVWDIAPTSTDSAADSFVPGSGGDTYFPAMENTPKVRCSVLRVIGESSCWVRIQAEFVYNPCQSVNIRGLGGMYNVASLRWWCADDIDTNSWLTRRVWSGYIQLKSRHVSPHIYRYLAFPALPLGWKRTGIRFSEAENGLSLQFEITDQEVVANPPYPASSWRGSVNITAPYAGIGKKDVTMNVELQAPKGVKKSELAFLVLKIIDSKIHWYTFVSRGAAFVTNIRMQETLEDNVVMGELNLTVTLPDVEKSKDSAFDIAGFPGFLRVIFGNDMSDPAVTGRGLGKDATFVRGYDPQRAAYAIPRGDSLASIVIPLIQTPCSTNAIFSGIVPQQPQAGDRNDNNQYRSGAGSSDSDLGKEDGVEPEPVTSEEAAAVEIASQSPYLSYKVSSRYMTDKGVSAFPVYGNFASSRTYPEVVIAKLRRPITRREFRFEAVRVNAWPVVPTDESFVDDAGIVHVCDTLDILANGVEASADGRRYRFSVSGVVTYILSRTPSLGEKMFVGSSPHITGQSDHEGSVHYLDGERRSGGDYRPDGTDTLPPPPPGPGLPPAPPDPPPIP